MGFLTHRPLLGIVAIALMLQGCAQWPKAQALQPIEIRIAEPTLPPDIPPLAAAPDSSEWPLRTDNVNRCTLWYVYRPKANASTPDLVAIGWYRPDSDDALRALARRWLWFADTGQAPRRLDMISLAFGSKRTVFRFGKHDYWAWQIPPNQTKPWLDELSKTLPYPRNPPGSMERVKRASRMAAITQQLNPASALDKIVRHTVLTADSPASKDARQAYNLHLQRRATFSDLVPLFAKPTAWVWITDQPFRKIRHMFRQGLKNALLCNPKPESLPKPAAHAENRWRTNVSSLPHAYAMDNASQATVQWLMPVGRYNAKRWAAAGVLSEILGSTGLSGRLPSDLRERQGLTYAVYADEVIWQPQMSLRITGTARYPQARALLLGIRAHLAGALAQGGISQEEFELAKQQRIWRLTLENASQPGQMRWVLRAIDSAWPQAMRDLKELSYEEFLSALSDMRHQPKWLFVAGDPHALKHYICEYFTKCIFVTP